MSVLLLIILKCLWFVLPAGIGNMFAQFSSVLLPKLNYPMDFNLSIKGVRVLGSHKTIRGLIAGSLFSAIFFYFQKYLYINSDFVRSISLFDYSLFPFVFGSMFGFGALIGDAIKSFFKRRVGIEPGKSWFPFDQIDWTIGALVFVAPFINLGPTEIIVSILIGLIIHLISKLIGFLIGTEKTAI